MCLCTGMLYDPAKEPPQVQSRMAPYIMFFRNKVQKTVPPEINKTI